MALLVGGVLTAPALAETAFPDVDEDAEYAAAAEYLSSIGVMQGDAQGYFNPDESVTRSQMAALVCRMLGESDDLFVNETRFGDVPISHWASGYIVKAASLGIINGYQDGTFKPDDSVSYEQVLAMLVRAMGKSDEAAEAGGYPDGIIAIAKENGYINQLVAEKGDIMARWQVAVILYNIVT